MSRDYFEEVRARLESARCEGETVVRWRLTWRESEGISAGVRDNHLLGVYTPLRAEKSRSGSFLLEWSDGTVSRGNLDGASLVNIDEILEASAQGRREDPDAAVFLGPQETPSTPLFDEEVARLVTSDPEPVAETARWLLEHGSELGARNTTTGVSAGKGHGGVWTSEGLRLEEPTTSTSFYSWLDGEVGEGFTSRRVFSLDEVRERLAGHDALYRATREDRKWGQAREARVVLHPHVVESFVDHFVLNNLSGSSVFHGTSRWSADDFRDRLQVAREDLVLGIEPDVPHHYGSFNFTSEGVPATDTAYVKEGRLAAPVLDLKYARKLGLDPTTPPRSNDSLRLNLDREEEWTAWASGVDDGVLVTSVLGMHTQDPVRGDYSLAVPSGVGLREGGLEGKHRVVLTGNFFEDLNREDLTAIRFPFHELPGLTWKARIAPDKG